jgi:hypothetical protein
MCLPLRRSATGLAEASASGLVKPLVAPRPSPSVEYPIPGRQTPTLRLLDDMATHVQARQNRPAHHAALPSPRLPMVFLDVGVRQCGSWRMAGHSAGLRGQCPAGVLCLLVRGLVWGSAARLPGSRSHHPVGLRCSSFAHRRCAYPWTSQHTYVVSMQIWRTTVDTSVRHRTGWWSSNSGLCCPSLRARTTDRVHPAAR